MDRGGDQIILPGSGLFGRETDAAVDIQSVHIVAVSKKGLGKDRSAVDRIKNEDFHASSGRVRALAAFFSISCANSGSIPIGSA